MENVMETPTARFQLDQDGIVHVEYKDLDSVSVEQAREDVETVNKLVKTLPVSIIVDISGAKSVSSEARDIYSSERARDSFKAVALVARTAISKVIGNFFLGINRPPMPVKLFTDAGSASEWLKTID